MIKKMSIMYDNYKHSDFTKEIIKVYYRVYNTLGYGFLEKVYENAMIIELKNEGYEVQVQKQIKVFYNDVEVGVYYADLIINNKIIIELKATESLCEEHEFQLINYLKASDIEVGLLLNFGKEPEFRRKVFTNIINHKQS